MADFIGETKGAMLNGEMENKDLIGNIGQQSNDNPFGNQDFNANLEMFNHGGINEHKQTKESYTQTGPKGGAGDYSYEPYQTRKSLGDGTVEFDEDELK